MQKKEGEMLFSFMKFDQMCRLGSRDRHTKWRSKNIKYWIIQFKWKKFRLQELQLGFINLYIDKKLISIPNKKFKFRHDFKKFKRMRTKKKSSRWGTDDVHVSSSLTSKHGISCTTTATYQDKNFMIWLNYLLPMKYKIRAWSKESQII